MIVIQDTLISDDLIHEKFVCNLNKCKGACCWEGDYGAPLKKKELKILEQCLPDVLPYLNHDAQQLLQSIKPYTYFDNADLHGTSLMPNGSCVFLTFDELGIGQCGIEKAYKDGKSTFQKPISCHLYPLRVTENSANGFETWNYEEWDICSAACTLGKELKVPVYQFLKDAIIRYKGVEFYEELCAAAEHTAGTK